VGKGWGGNRRAMLCVEGSGKEKSSKLHDKTWREKERTKQCAFIFIVLPLRILRVSCQLPVYGDTGRGERGGISAADRIGEGRERAIKLNVQ